MSGPKVVRVVTREELVAESARLLRQLDVAIAMWISEGQRIGILDDADVSAVRKSREEIVACIRDDRFDEVRRRVPAEMESLNNDLDCRRAKAVEAAVQARQRGRQQKENAGAILKEFKKRSNVIDENVLLELQNVAIGKIAGGEADAILGKYFALLTSDTSERELTALQRELLEKLISKDRDGQREKWVAPENQPQDVRLQDLDRHLAELDVYLGGDAIEEFSGRLKIIESQVPGPTTNMQVDTLVLDLVNAVKAAKSETNILGEAKALFAELSAVEIAIGTEGIVYRAGLEAAISNKDIASLPQLITTGLEVVAELQKRNASEARRATILSALSALGYEVREGMSTAWVEKGRIVVHKPNLPGYGVELAGGADAERLQVRAVAFSGDRDLNRDRDVETLWCGDFEKLRKLVSGKGNSIVIERALAIGASPLKVVNIEDPNYVDHHGVPAARKL